MARPAPRKGRPGLSYRTQALRLTQLAWRVLVALGAAALACIDLIRHLLLCLIAAVFGWRFGSR